MSLRDLLKCVDSCSDAPSEPSCIRDIFRLVGNSGCRHSRRTIIRRWLLRHLLRIPIVTVRSAAESTRLGIARCRREVWRNIDSLPMDSTRCHILRVAKVAEAIACQAVNAVIAGSVVCKDRGALAVWLCKLGFDVRCMVTDHNDLVNFIKAPLRIRLVLINTKSSLMLGWNGIPSEVDKLLSLS